MGFADLLRNGVAILDSLTVDLQATVQHYSWVSQDGKGRDTFSPARTGAGTSRSCVVDYTRKQRTRPDGRKVNVVATLTFPRPVAVTPRDVFICPNGTTAPVLSAPNAPVDPSTNAGYFTEVELGEL